VYEIAAIRTEASADQSHEHVTLVGYNSPHIEGEQILIPIARIPQRQALGEEFGLRVGDEMVPLTTGTCDVCGQPILKTAKGSLLDLPRK
jgi:hypothetical protein